MWLQSVEGYPVTDSPAGVAGERKISKNGGNVPIINCQIWKCVLDTCSVFIAVLCCAAARVSSQSVTRYRKINHDMGADCQRHNNIGQFQ